MTGNCGENEPVTRDDALELAYDLLLRSADLAENGREVEAQVVNQVAVTALGIADRAGGTVATLSGGPH